MDELVVIGIPYGEFRKSDTSCVIVEMPRKYLRPRFAMEKRKDAVSCERIIHHASSMTRRRLRNSLRTVVQMWCVMMYIATGLWPPSMSRTERTPSVLFPSTFLARYRQVERIDVVFRRERNIKVTAADGFSKIFVFTFRVDDDNLRVEHERTKNLQF